MLGIYKNYNKSIISVIIGIIGVVVIITAKVDALFSFFYCCCVIVAIMATATINIILLIYTYIALVFEVIDVT